MSSDESPKIEPTLTSVSDAPSVTPSAEAPAPDAAKLAGSTVEAVTADAKPAAPKAEDILAEVARANAKNNAFLKPESILADAARAKAAAPKSDAPKSDAPKSENGAADAAAVNKAAAPKAETILPPASRLYVEPGIEKEPRLERKAKPEPTPEAKREPYRSAVVMRMPPGGTSGAAGASSNADVVVKPSATRLALVAALMAIAASFGAIGGSVGVAKFGPLFAAAPPPPAPVTKDNVAEEVKLLKETVAQLRGTTKSLSDNLAALKTSVNSSNNAQNTQIGKIAEALDRVEKAQADLRKTAAAVATAPAHMASTTQAVAASDTTGSIKQQQQVPMVLGEPPQNLKPPVVQGWVLRRVYDGAALIEGRDGIIEVETGSIAPGLGRIEGIKRQDGRWVVLTARGMVVGR